MSESTANTQLRKPRKVVKKKGFRFCLFLLKLGFTFCCYLAFYLIYLDWRIQSRMEGQIWRLPAEVYSQIESIRSEDKHSLESIRQILLDNNYRQTSMIAASGDFKVENNTIVLIRRAFPFPDKPEAQRVFRLRFIDDKLSVIEDLINRKVIPEFKMAPKLISMLQSDKEERLAISLQNYPRLLIDALLLTEDKRFYQHDGISLPSIARAMITNWQAGHTVQGGSTLTQQLVKNLFLSNERSLVRKVNEALMAILLDLRYDKNRILETYLNEVYLGQDGDTQIHGFELASQFFFGRPTREISLDQMALLVGMVKGPSLYNPWRNPNNALERRNIVLRLLVENKIIGSELYEMLSKRPLGVQKRGMIMKDYPAFLQTVQYELREYFSEAKTSSLLGARIFTSLDIEQQRRAEAAVVQGTNQLQLKNKNPHLQSAMVIADYHTGTIKAVVGGLQTNYAGFNRALMTKRQIGSLIKPSIYLIALSDPDSFRLNTPIKNRPITIYTKGAPPWSPRNYSRRYGGSVMLMNALVYSLNIPTVNIGMKVGLEKVINGQKKMGWDTVKIPKVPSMLLGAYSISPYEVTKLYQVIANQGGKIPLSTINIITDRKGEVIYQHNLEPEQVVPQEAAFQTLFAMQRVVDRGTARSLQADFPDLHLAGKTGTTNNARDSWYVGIDGENVITVWVGRDDNGETNLTGSTGALMVYKDYLHRSIVTPLKLKKPSTMQWVGINAYGSWDCGNPNTIPVWNNNQIFCNSSITQSSSNIQSNTDVVTKKEEELWEEEPQPEEEPLQPETPQTETEAEPLVPVEEAVPAQ